MQATRVLDRQTADSRTSATESLEQSEPPADGDPGGSTSRERRADPEYLDTRPDRPSEHSDGSHHDDDRVARSGERTFEGTKAALRRHPFAIIILHSSTPGRY